MQNKTHKQYNKLIISTTVLGKGEFGEVLKGTLNEKPVAIKKINISDSEENKTNAKHEIDIHKKLKHPNVLSLISSIEIEKNIYIVLELVTGGDLSLMIFGKKGTLNKSQRESIILDIAKGLEFIHDSDVLHRDLKPENILLTNKFQAKISDFGFAINLSEVNQCYFAGTPSYIAPEIIYKPTFYSKCTDIYAFGVLMLETFREESAYSKFGNLTQERIFILTQNNIHDDIPEETPDTFKDIINECIAFDPNNRPTIKTIVHRLNDYIQTPKQINETISTTNEKTPLLNPNEIRSNYSFFSTKSHKQKEYSDGHEEKDWPCLDCCVIQ